MTQKYMLEIAKKHNINNEDQVYEACEFVLEMIKELHDEMIRDEPGAWKSNNIIKDYTTGSWVVNDLLDEIELIVMTQQNDL